MRLNAEKFLAMKGKTLITMLTAYTYPVARCLEKAGVPIILVGDTLGMVEMGHKSTRPVTVEQMCYHVAAVRRGAPETHVIGDLPYQSDNDPDSTLKNSRLLIEAGADSVKLEGPKTEIIAHLVDNHIDVIGHTGLTPQTAENFKQVGREKDDAARIIDESEKIAAAGAFMVVLEHIPAKLAGQITAQLKVPTIGIGAGAACDGQVLVINDAIGLGDYWPPFSKQYAYVSQTVEDVARQFMHEVTERKFPA